MSSIVVAGDVSGSVTIAAPSAAGSTTLTLPSTSGTFVTDSASQTLTNKTLTSPTLTTPALGTPASGTLTNCTGLPLSTGVTGSLAASSLPAGSVLQVVSSTKTDTFSSSTTGSWLDVTGLSVSVTPSSSSNKIMVFGRVVGAGTNGGTRMQMRLVRDSTAISLGDAAGSRTRASSNELYTGDSGAFLGSVIFYLDSPSSTSSVTYKLQVLNGNGSDTIYVNRSQTDSDASNYARGSSSITVMEIKG